MRRFSVLDPSNRLILAHLRRQWALFSGLCLAWLLGGYLILRAAWGTDAPVSYALRWTLLSAPALAYLLWVLWSGLEHNRRLGESRLLPGLGAGNLMTLLRGMLLAGLIGFLFSPRPPGWLAWIPGLLYTLAITADYLDGYLARITNHATRLGEILDMSIDGLGVLAAAWLAVQWGQAPAWYLSVGLVRYLFIAGTWMLRRLNRPVYDLEPSVRRRGFAGLQMGLLAALLWPLFSPPGTHLAAAIFAFPFLAGFAWDWLVVSGALKTEDFTSRLAGKLLHWATLLLRLLVLVLAVPSLAAYFVRLSGMGQFADLGWSSAAGSLLVFTLMESVLVLLVLVGASGRIAAILGLLLLGVQQMSANLEPAQLALVVVYTAILFLGTGPFSLWTPEDRLIYRRAGENTTTSPKLAGG